VVAAGLKSVVPGLANVDSKILARLDIDGTLPIFHGVSVHFLHPIGQYDAHLARQASDLRVFAEDESLILDPKLDYSSIPGLSGEVIERLYRIQPTTIVCLLCSCVVSHEWRICSTTGLCKKNGRHDANIPHILT